MSVPYRPAADNPDAPHITLEADGSGWLVIHSRYTAKDDIKAFPYHPRWDRRLRKWRVPEDAWDSFADFMRGRGYVVHDPHDDRENPFEGLD